MCDAPPNGEAKPFRFDKSRVREIPGIGYCDGTLLSNPDGHYMYEMESGQEWNCVLFIWQ
jgi:hypothetical protein